MNLKLYIKSDIKNFYSSIKMPLTGQYSKNAFFSTAIAGILIHLLILTNYIVNHDSVLSISSSSDWLITQGKWFVTPLSSIEGALNLNYLGTIIGIAFISLSASVICAAFEIQSKLYCRMIGICIAAFPAIATINAYDSLDYFGGAFFLAVLSAYLMIRPGFLNKISGIVFLTLATAAYQAYLGAALAILVLHCTVSALNNQKFIKVVKSGILYVAEAVVAIGAYYLILQNRLNASGASLTDYKGISNMAGNLAPMTLLRSAYRAVHDVKEYFLHDILGVYGKINAYWSVALLILLAAAAILAAVRSGAIKKPGNMIIAIGLLLFCLPISINIVGLLAANTSFYYISIFPFVLVFISPLILLYQPEQSEPGASKAFLKRNAQMIIPRTKQILTVLICAAMLLISFNWTVQDNIVYHKLMLINKEYDSKITALTERIQSAEGYSDTSVVVFVGDAPFVFAESQGALRLFEDTYSTVGMGVSNSTGILYNHDVLRSYMQNVLSISFNYEAQDTVIAENRDEIEAMPVYPYDGSIKKSDDGKIIVKLSNTLPDTKTP